jgi:transcriptional regulator with XRE-family HTH domain
MKSSLGERIRKLRVIRNLSQENMANELNLSTAAYSNIERDVTDLTVSRLVHIAKVLDINPIQFFDDVNYQVAEIISKNNESNSDIKKVLDELSQLKLNMQKMESELQELKKKQSKLRK